MRSESKHATVRLKARFLNSFLGFYSREVAEQLAEIHVLYHRQFVQELLKQTGPGMAETEDAGLIKPTDVRVFIEQKLRRARDEDVYPKGPNAKAVMEEVYEFIQSCGAAYMRDIANFTLVLGCDYAATRAAVRKLEASGRVKRDKKLKVACYRCVK
jgi:hypothetical protein